MVWSFSEKTTFTGFTTAQQATILAAMQTAYDGSSTARTMFHNWIDAGNTIKIANVPGVFKAYFSTGRVEIDLAFLNNASYIDLTGTAVKDTLVTALVHELGHALTGKKDNDITSIYSVKTADYRGDNVNFVNQIYKELGLPEQVSYIAYDTSGTLHKLNYKYTNGAAIDAARSGDINMSSAALGVSNDLLIGGPSANFLQSSDGNDFLFGAGGDDQLNGGAGRDIAVYFGTPLDYDIRRNPDGSWAVRNVRGAKDAGSDTLKNVEVVQFDGGKTYELKKGGLTFQTDFALVIDTTGSMGSSIGRVKAQASSLINAVFAGGNNDGRIGVVGFKDTTNGEPSRVILRFTDQNDFATRKSAAIAAINSITVGGGGDLPETSFDGLRLALSDSMGEWRFGAGVLRIALFTDAAAKDGALAGEVNNLARSIGATIVKRSSLVGSGGSVDTFNLAFGGDGSSGTKRSNLDDPNANPDFPFVPSDDPITPDPTTAQVQIFTIFTGPSGVDTSALESIADTTGGDFLTATTPDDLVNILLKIIELPPEGVNTPPTAVDDSITTRVNTAVTIDALANDSDAEGNALTITAVTDPANGSTAIVDGQIRFTPDALFLGENSFNYTVSDGKGGEATATVTVSVLLPENAIVGTIKQDSLNGTNLGDVISGEGGNDNINGNGGKDIIFGGDGDDNINGSNSTEHITGGAGNDRIMGNGGDDLILGGLGDDDILLGTGKSTINSGSGNDKIWANNASATFILETGDGFDTIYGLQGQQLQLRQVSFGVSDVGSINFQRSGNGLDILSAGDKLAHLDNFNQQWQVDLLNNNKSDLFLAIG